MSYAVDFVVNVMDVISSSRPVMFQRDGGLYVVSQQGLGHVSYGLRTSPEKIQDWELREQPPEILESTDVIRTGTNQHGDWRKVVDEERPYFQAMCFGPDSNQFTLKEISESAAKLAELPDDGKIRMVLHRSNYHSHKYGYAADGIDVFVVEGRVMDRARYLEILRNREDQLFEEITEMAEKPRPSFCGQSSRYASLRIPDCVVITPNMMMTLPRKGVTDVHHRESGWTDHTRFENHWSGSTKGSIVHQSDVSDCNESPYSVHVMLNSNLLSASTSEEFSSAQGPLVKRISQEFNVVNSYMGDAKQFIARMNEVHKQLCAEDIESWNRIHRTG